MPHRPPTRAPWLVLALLLLGGPALAQGASCGSLRAELAQLGRASGGTERAIQRQTAALTQAIGVARSLGCDRPFQFFGGDPRCPSINAQIQGMRASLNAMGSRADLGRSARRAQVRAAYERYCLNDPGEREEVSRPARVDPNRGAAEDADDEDEDGPRRTRGVGGGAAVCVRACDGYYFPLDARGGNDADEMCKALCPGAETEAYRLGPGREIESAVSVSGRAYSELPRALAFRTTRDKTCGCRRPGESWAQSLAAAEELLGRRKGDVLVTEEQSQVMSRPPAARRRGGRDEAVN